MCKGSLFNYRALCFAHHALNYGEACMSNDDYELLDFELICDDFCEKLRESL